MIGVTGGGSETTGIGFFNGIQFDPMMMSGPPEGYIMVTHYWDKDPPGVK